MERRPHSVQSRMAVSALIGTTSCGAHDDGYVQQNNILGPGDYQQLPPRKRLGARPCMNSGSLKYTRYPSESRVPHRNLEALVPPTSYMRRNEAPPNGPWKNSSSEFVPFLSDPRNPGPHTRWWERPETFPHGAPELNPNTSWTQFPVHEQERNRCDIRVFNSSHHNRKFDPVPVVNLPKPIPSARPILPRQHRMVELT